MKKLNYDISSYKWHGSTSGDFFQGWNSQDPNSGTDILLDHHPYKADFGPGFYLGDNKEQACAWAARDGGTPSLNIFEINETALLSQCLGTYVDFDILDWTSVHSLIVWSILCSEDRTEWMSYQENDSRLQAIELYSECINYISQCDWILGKRSDDRLWQFVPLFFANQTTVYELWEAAVNCSLGNQLVIKTEDARNCIRCCDATYYDIRAYIGVYDNAEQEAKELYDIYQNNYRQVPITGQFPSMDFGDFRRELELYYQNGVPLQDTTLKAN